MPRKSRPKRKQQTDCTWNKCRWPVITAGCWFLYSATLMRVRYILLQRLSKACPHSLYQHQFGTIFLCLYSVCSQQLCPVHMLSNCISGGFFWIFVETIMSQKPCADILRTVIWAYSAQACFSALGIRNLRTIKAAGAGHLMLQRNILQRTWDPSSFLLWWLDVVAQLSSCNVFT